MSRWSERCAGHWWTVAPAAKGWLPTSASPAAVDVSIPVVDDLFGATWLSGSFGDCAGAEDAVVLVHGLGSSRQARCVVRAAGALQRRGFATLAVDLRGADRRGGGFYHVAQVEDLLAVCRAPELRRFARVFVLGFSMGGHLAIHFAATDGEPRLCGVASLCSPLDLAATQQHNDAPRQVVYRHYVLRGLKQIYGAVANRHDNVPSPNADVQRCRTFFDWDRLAIAPRYGFDSPEAFYRERSAARSIPDLRVETILVMAAHDPIIPPWVTVPHASAAPTGRLHLRVLPRGGHLEFPRGQSLGLPGAGGGAGVVDQIASHWRRLGARA